MTPWLLHICLPTIFGIDSIGQQHPPGTLIFYIFLSASLTERLSTEHYWWSIVWYCSVVSRAFLAERCNPFGWLLVFYHPCYHEQWSPRKTAAPHTCGRQQDPPQSWHHAESAWWSLQQKRGTQIWQGCLCKYFAGNSNSPAHDEEEAALHTPPARQASLPKPLAVDKSWHQGALPPITPEQSPGRQHTQAPGRQITPVPLQIATSWVQIKIQDVDKAAPSKGSIKKRKEETRLQNFRSCHGTFCNRFFIWWSKLTYHCQCTSISTVWTP